MHIYIYYFILFHRDTRFEYYPLMASLGLTAKLILNPISLLLLAQTKNIRFTLNTQIKPLFQNLKIPFMNKLNTFSFNNLNVFKILSLSLFDHLESHHRTLTINNTTQHKPIRFLKGNFSLLTSHFSIFFSSHE